MLKRVKQALINVGANIIGCVLNNTDIRHDEYYEYYTSYYQYYSTAQSSNLKPSPSDSGVENDAMKKAAPIRDARGEY